jgi:hypothetical protein
MSSACRRYSCSNVYGTSQLEAAPTSLIQGMEENGYRSYFYVIDDKGQLFLNDTKHKNFVSCLKDKVFLNMFYRLLRRNQNQMATHVPNQALSEYIRREFPLISPCGHERNFTRIEDSFAACVFSQFLVLEATGNDNMDLQGSAMRGSVEEKRDLSLDRSSSAIIPSSAAKAELIIGGSDLRETFHPSCLYYSPKHGRFYHEIRSHKYLKSHPSSINCSYVDAAEATVVSARDICESKVTEASISLGLLHGLISQRLSHILTLADTSNEGGEGEERYQIKWNNRIYHIHNIIEE